MSSGSLKSTELGEGDTIGCGGEDVAGAQDRPPSEGLISPCFFTSSRRRGVQAQPLSVGYCDVEFEQT